MVKKIAITGGIGTGKSFISKIFGCFGIPIFDSDAHAKYIMEYDNDIVIKIIDAFGDVYYSTNPNIINRKKLADIVFNDKIALKKLNNIVHPAVRKRFQNWVENFNELPPYVIFESAIIFESGMIDMFDKVITVSTDLEIRIERAMKRDNASRENVLKRINNQLSDEYKIEHSDFVITNNKQDIEESYLDLIPQIYKINNKIV